MRGDTRTIVLWDPDVYVVFLGPTSWLLRQCVADLHLSTGRPSDVEGSTNKGSGRDLRSGSDWVAVKEFI